MFTNQITDKVSPCKSCRLIFEFSILICVMDRNIRTTG